MKSGNFFAELKRPNVYKVADRDIYVVTLIKHLRGGE
jgi:hypothetical protein